MRRREYTVQVNMPHGVESRRNSLSLHRGIAELVGFDRQTVYISECICPRESKHIHDADIDLLTEPLLQREHCLSGAIRAFPQRNDNHSRCAASLPQS